MPIHTDHTDDTAGEGELQFSGPDSHSSRNVVAIAATACSYSLPLELLRPIFVAVDEKATLCSLLRVSRAFYEEALPLAYREFRSPFNAMNHAAHVQFFERIIADGRLARYVKTFYLHLHGIPTEQDENYYVKLATALRAMTNLKSLLFRDSGGSPRCEILRGCTFRLEELYWQSRPQLDGELLADFLSHQEAVVKFEGRWDEGDIVLPSSAMPKLVDLCGPYGVFVALVPGRSVTHMVLDPDLDDPPVMNVALIGPSLHALRSLRWGGYFGPPPLEPLLPYLGSLEDLQIPFTKMDNHIGLVRRLPRLRRFCIPIPYYGQSGFQFSEDGRVKELFDACPTLTDVLINNPRTSHPRTYWHWRRDTYPAFDEGELQPGVFEWP